MGCGASTDTEVDATVHRHLHLDPAMRSQVTLRAIPGANNASPSRRSAHTRASFAEDGLSRASSRALSVATGRGRNVSRSATLADREMRFFEDADRAMMEAELYSDGSTVADGEPGSTSLAIDRAKRILAARVSHGINGDPCQFDPEFFEDKAAVGRVREWFLINADAGMPLKYSPPPPPPAPTNATPATPKQSSHSRSSALSAAEKALNTAVSPAMALAPLASPGEKAISSPGYAPLPIPGNEAPTMTLPPSTDSLPLHQQHQQQHQSHPRPHPAGATSPRTPVTTTTATNKYVIHDGDPTATATDDDLRRSSTGPQSVNLDASNDSFPRATMGASNNGDPYAHLGSSRRHRQHPENQMSRNTPEDVVADRGMAPTLANLGGIRGGSYSVTRDPLDDGRDSISESSRSGFGDVDGFTSPGSTFRAGGSLAPRTTPKMPPFLTCYFGERNIQLRLIERMATGLRFPLQECTLAAHDRIIEATWERAQHPHRAETLR